MKVLISLGKSFYEIFPDLGQWLRKEGIEVVEQIGFDYEPPKGLIKQLISDADVYVVGVDKVDREIMAAAPKLKLIIKHGAGFDNVDLNCAKEKKIAVAFAKGGNAQSVAELAIALMLSVCRGVSQCSAEIKAGGWSLFMGCELHGKTLGLIGYGNVGKRVAKMAQGFGMEVLAFDPYLENGVLEGSGVRLTSMEDVLKTADFVSLHAPATEENQNLINDHTIRMMKPTAYLINTARGDLVDEEALALALREKRLSGAALDVFKQEPPNREFAALKGIVLTPHLGACTVDSARNLSVMSFENIMHFKNQQPLINRLV